MIGGLLTFLPSPWVACLLPRSLDDPQLTIDSRPWRGAEIST